MLDSHNCVSDFNSSAPDVAKTGLLTGYRVSELGSVHIGSSHRDTHRLRKLVFTVSSVRLRLDTFDQDGRRLKPHVEEARSPPSSAEVIGETQRLSASEEHQRDDRA